MPAPAPKAHDYWRLSARPLHALVFLLPVIVLYEAGSLIYLAPDGQAQTIRAQGMLRAFFDWFGVAGLMAPGVAVVVVLLLWHLIARDRWRVRGAVLLGMALESALWSLPLVVFGALVQRAAALVQTASGAAGTAGTGGLYALTWEGRLTISLGAGVYEELLFRMVGMALIHLLCKDVLQLSERTARVVAVVGSALAFGLYHDQSFASLASAPGPVVAGLNLLPLGFYTASGVYFACLYQARGFGIVVGAHAVYDILVLVILG